MTLHEERQEVSSLRSSRAVAFYPSGGEVEERYFPSRGIFLVGAFKFSSPGTTHRACAWAQDRKIERGVWLHLLAPRASRDASIVETRGRWLARFLSALNTWHATNEATSAHAITGGTRTRQLLKHMKNTLEHGHTISNCSSSRTCRHKTESSHAHTRDTKSTRHIT